MSYFEFPHTRTYDSDLGWIIKQLKTMLDALNELSTFKNSANSDIEKLKSDVNYLIKSLSTPPSDWDPDVAYRIYSLVTYEDTTYIALKDVPVGVGIGDERYWAVSTSIKVQIDAMQLAIEELQNSIQDETLDLFFPYLLQNYDPTGSCGFLKIGDGGIMFDAGREANKFTITQQLKNIGVTKIDAVVISHWDGDHTSEISGFTYFKESFDMSETVFYLPRGSAKLGTDVALNQFLAIFPNNTAIYPEESEEYTFNDLTLKFYNCGLATTEYWDANADGNQNEYSMVCYVTYHHNTICFMGDASILAQTKMYDESHYMRASLITSPHHGANAYGSIPLALEIGAKIVYINDDFNVAATTGMRCPFTETFAIFNALSYRNSNNPNGTHFGVGMYGCTITSGYPTPMGGYSDQFIINYKVDSTTTSTTCTGTSKNPFPSLRMALSACKPDWYYYIEVVNVDSAETAVIYGKNNITIDLIGHTIASATINGCNNIIIFNGTISNGLYLQQSNILRFNSMTIDHAQASYCSNLVFNTLTAYSDIATFLNLLNTIAIIDGIVTTGKNITTLINLTKSSLTINFAFGQLGPVVTKFAADAVSVINTRTIDAGSLLADIYKQAKPVLVYDTTQSQYGIVRAGAITHIATT